MIDTQFRQNEVVSQMIQQLGRELLDREVADMMGISEERINELRMISLDPVSIDKSIVTIHGLTESHFKRSIRGSA